MESGVADLHRESHVSGEVPRAEIEGPLIALQSSAVVAV